MFSEIGEYNRALEDYHRAITIYPTATTYYYRGRVYHRLGKYQEAIMDMKNAASLGNIEAQKWLLQEGINR